MLNLNEKIKYFENSISIKNENYGDVMKDELYLHFFENENNFDFLNPLESEKEIESKIEFLISKMIMNEHQDGLTSIINNYVQKKLCDWLLHKVLQLKEGELATIEKLDMLGFDSVIITKTDNLNFKIDIMKTNTYAEFNEIEG